jgi:hypothetical protein
MAIDQEATAKFAVQEAQVKYQQAAAAAAKNPGNSPDAKRDQAAAIQAKAVLDEAIAAAAIKAADAAVAEAKAQSIAATKAAAGNVGAGLDAKKDQAVAVAAAKTLTKVIAAAKEIKINADPTVIAAKANQAAAAGEVTATDKSLAEALANLEALTNSLNDGPSIEVTQALRDATVGLDTNAGLGTLQPTPTVEQDNFQASIDEAAGMDSTPDPDSINFADLTPEQQAAIGGLDTNQGLGNSGFSAAQIPGVYTFDAKTGLLLLDGQPYTGSWNGSDYEAGAKGEPTKGLVAKSMADFNDPAGGGRVIMQGPSDAELARMDAFAQLQDLFDSYGLGSLAGKIAEYMKQGKGPNETVLLLKQSPEYNTRFYGNTLRKTAGLNVMSEVDYLTLEDSYANTLRAYGLGNMLSADRTKNEAMFATYMGNDIAAPEFKNRIQLATDRVMNADSMTKGIFKEFYPNLTDADLVSYFLSPKDTLSKLQEKVTSAEIGSAAVAQGLETSMASATELAKFGIDKNAAIQGYANVKEALPTSQKLGDIYGETGIKYDQATGEAEFLKGNQDAAQKRKRLKSLERASFQGETGISQGSGLVRSVQGKF